MQKNSTHFHEASIIPHDENDMMESLSQEMPGDTVIQNILNYSKALKVEKSPSAGVIEIILN